MNHFFALLPTEEACENLAQMAVAWKGVLGSLPTPLPCRWYEPADYHVTLKFLGDLEEVGEALILAGLAAAQQASPFVLTVAGMGAFPDSARPRILWLGLEQNPHLSELVTSLEAEAVSCGLTRETRPCLPHLTVARSTPPQNPAWVHIPCVKERTFASFAVDRLVLMQTLPPESRANGKKARYNIVHTFPFENAHLSDVY